MRSKLMMAAVLFLAVFMLSGCDRIHASDLSEETLPVTSLPMIQDSQWQYNEDDDVFYQLGLRYCELPSAEGCQELAIFVPGRYMSAEPNGNGTYTCTIDYFSQPGRFSASDAPVVFPVGNQGYASRMPLTEYTREAAVYTEAGFIYAYAGCRGKEDDDLADITDFKAAIRYMKLNDELIPGDMSRIFCTGMAEGGSRAVLLGVTGDSPLYGEKLKKIGAIEGVSDSVFGVQAWCPSPSPEMADESYEWMMGNTRTGLSEENRQLSMNMAAAYAEYINKLGLTDEDGDKLTLSQSEDGRFQSGSYYDYIRSIIEKSLNRFLSDTVYPYKASGGTLRHPVSGTFRSASEYIRALNTDREWVNFDAAGNKATISSIADFTMACKPAVRMLAASEANTGKVIKDENVLNALSPLYFLLPSRDGYNTSKVARHFRINSGLWQTETSLCTEANLTAALASYGSDVKLTAVWGMKHTTAERSGTGTANLINWITKCCRE